MFSMFEVDCCSDNWSCWTLYSSV